MIIDLDCISDASYNCYQTAIITIANFYKAGFQMMAIGKWCFHYKAELDDRIGNRLEPNYGRDIVGYSFFHGIDLAIYSGNQDVSRDVFIQLLKENKPIIIHCDIFTCRWFKAYGKYHMPHCYIVYGFLEDSEKFVCMDPFLNEKYIECDCADVIQNMIDFRVASVRNKPIDPDAVRSELLNDVAFYDEDKTYQNIKQFAHDIKEHMDIDKELGGYNTDLYAVPLLDNIKAINLYRKSYMLMLTYIDELSEVDFKEIIDKAKNCIAEWELVRVALMKIFVTKNMSLLDKVVMRINTANEFEREMFRMLKVCCERRCSIQS